MIKVEGIHFKREARSILSNISFHMQAGEHWVILGRNGSGKSTILEMLNGYLFPSSGHVQVLGNVYGTCDVREVRKSIGYISQSLIEKFTFRDPVWEIVVSGEYGYLRMYEQVPEPMREKAIAMLDKVGLAHLQDQSFGLLSQGERKKVLLARVLMSAPAILIMDEPCAGLDLYERERFLNDLSLFEEQQMNLVYVTHHIEEITSVFSHVLLLDEGKVVAAGKKEQVLTPEFIYGAYGVRVELDWVNGRPWIRVL